MSTATHVSLVCFPKFCFIGPTTLNLITGGIFNNWISSSFHVVFKSRRLFFLMQIFVKVYFSFVHDITIVNTVHSASATTITKTCRVLREGMAPVCRDGRPRCFYCLPPVGSSTWLKRGLQNGCMTFLNNHIKSHMSNIEQWLQ